MSLNDDQSIELVPQAPDRERALQPVAQAALRECLRAPSTLRRTGLGAFGRDAIAQASDAAGRLSNETSASSATALLGEVEALAAKFNPAPDQGKRWRFFGRRTSTSIPNAYIPSRNEIGDLVGRIERERDRVILNSITLATDLARFADADAALVEVLHLIRSARSAVGAAVREIRGEDPSRAHRVDQDAEAILTERERDVLTQIVIVRQGTMTLELLIDNQTVLAKALDRVRAATLSALQIALAARLAADQSRDLVRQSDPLPLIGGLAVDSRQTVDQAKLMIGGAVIQARLALDAMATSSRR